MKKTNQFILIEFFATLYARAMALSEKIPKFGSIGFVHILFS